MQDTAARAVQPHQAETSVHAGDRAYPESVSASVSTSVARTISRPFPLITRRLSRFCGDELLALMVTDIAGFTAIVERLGDLEARLLIRAHNRLLRECLRQWRGAEITHTGDGLLVAFRSVGNALACAIEMQRRVVDYSSSLELPLRVRIGVHVGEPLPEDGRLFGACINTTVRVCAATEAERIMVSELACALAAGRALPFVFHGAVVLKGVADPISLHELLWREAPDSRAS